MNILAQLALRFRRLRYKLLSGGYAQLTGKPDLQQPLVINGNGRVRTGKGVQLGVEESPGFWSTYAYFDVRGQEALIELGDQVVLNNNAALCADGASIVIGRYTVAGVNLSIMTSDGHTLDPSCRHEKGYPCASVQIGENVFIGDNVTLLKGVSIGDNCTIGAHSVVTHDIPANSIAAGNPAHILREI
jgi:acetyltransferase-like isoleucine patch superfamily enzyme